MEAVAVILMMVWSRKRRRSTLGRNGGEEGEEGGKGRCGDEEMRITMALLMVVDGC